MVGKGGSDGGLYAFVGMFVVSCRELIQKL